MSVSRENGASSRSTAPLVKTVEVAADTARAFAVFTEELAGWWPLATHSVGGGDAVDVVLNPGLGGRIVETMSDGRTAVWGTVTVWDPPHEVAFTWHPGRAPQEATEVWVRFTPTHAGTAVELTHGGWDARDDSAFARQGYDAGWAVVLGRFATAAV
jgi:hypothetical protein